MYTILCTKSRRNCVAPFTEYKKLGSPRAKFCKPPFPYISPTVTTNLPSLETM